MRPPLASRSLSVLTATVRPRVTSRILLRPTFAQSLCCPRYISRAAAMPLRSKRGSRLMATATSQVKPDPSQTGDEEVLYGSVYGLRTFLLNRPKKLNSLNGNMIDLMTPRLVELLKSTLAQIILIKGSGEKAFCAGGDVAALALQNDTKEGVQKSADYFASEYKLDHLLATYDKPVVTFIDGITMGGGVGLSLHSPFRVATERTMFAMPETAIGLFPDVGASFFLPRLDGQIGTYLGLTGERITGGDCLYANIATHYVHSSALPAIETRLAELEFDTNLTYMDRIAVIDSTLAEYVSETPPLPKISGELRTTIDFVFSPNSIQEILQRLEQVKNSSSVSEKTQQWAEKITKALLERSPTSLHATLRLIRLGAGWKLAEAFQREHALASHFMSDVPDFNNGVRAKLITKPAATPEWKPATIDEVTPQAIDKLFEPAGKRLTLLNENGKDSKHYVHRNVTGLPYEDHVAAVVCEVGHGGSHAVLDYILNQYGGRFGVRTKVEEILARKTKDNGTGGLEWVGA